MLEIAELPWFPKLFNEYSIVRRFIYYDNIKFDSSLRFSLFATVILSEYREKIHNDPHFMGQLIEKNIQMIGFIGFIPMQFKVGSWMHNYPNTVESENAGKYWLQHK